jgi:hypothetical protein
MSRTRRPIKQAGLAIGAEAVHPPVSTLTRHAEFLRDMSNRTPVVENTSNEQTATVDSEPGVSVGYKDLLAEVETSDIPTKPGGRPISQAPRHQLPCEYS